MITFDGVRKAFGERTVLDGIALDVGSARVTALVGPNGSGKTTLIKILLGLSRPDAGSVRIAGVELDADGGYRRNVGYMPQAAKFPDHLRVREVVGLVTALRPGAARDEELLAAFALDQDWNRPVGTLSGGTRQKLNAAIAFLFGPSVIVLDEPTAGLDPIASGVLRDRIRRDQAAGRTVIVTSHVLSELEELAQDIAFLCEGRLRFVGSTPELLARTGAARVEPAIAVLMRESRAQEPAVAHGAGTPAPAPEAA